ncbi:MAG: GIY-YIG nuclease family protein [Selenomonadaceae bacterium]|nr:GIY-YIG nuclease family protein [Selenomonadaceae bacterium]
MDEPGVIYFIWNMINGKRYVGQTTNSLKKRMAQHKSGNLVVDKAIQKYGIKNFRYGVIKSCASREELNCWEKYFIAALKTKHPYGYNFTDGGDCNFTVSDESRAKMSAKRKGVQKSPEHRAKIKAALSGENHYFFGQHHTKKTRAKISASQSGENHYFFGKHNTDESRSKMSVTRRGSSPFKNLIAELDARKMSYHRLASILDLSQAAVSMKMSGKRNFTTKDKIKLEEIFCKSAEFLLQRDC